MAIATVDLVCSTCGANFTHRHKCYNRNEANRYEDWAANNIHECPECRARRLKAEREEARVRKYEQISLQIQGLGIVLPDISGTERQIAYANDLRMDHLGRDENYPIYVAVIQRHEAGDYDGLRALISSGRDPREVSDAELDSVVADLRADDKVNHATMIALCGDAKKLIDALK